MSTLNLLPHNRKAYDSVCHKLKSGSRSVLYVAGTGTGKTFVTNALLDTVWSGCKVAYVVPTFCIWDYLQSVLSDTSNITVFTYSAFANEDTLSTLRDFDVIIFDEAHHLGSSIEGANAVQLISEFSGIAFGITATPCREDGTDVSVYFDKTVYGLSNYNAIRGGLMPQFEYYICNPTSLKPLADKYKIAVDLPQSSDIVKQITEIHAVNKILAFYGTVTDMYVGILELQTMFPNYKVVSLSYKSENVMEALDTLKNSDKVILASCDMLLEGLHVSTVDAVMLFRNVQSATVLQQILGRVSNIGSTKNPVVMDFTNTAFKLFCKILNTDYSGRKVRAGASRSQVPAKPMLRLPVQNVEVFDIMMLLSAVNGDPITVFGKEFSSLKAAALFYGVAVKKLYSVISQCHSIEEAFLHSMEKRYYIGGKYYSTLNGVCVAYAIPLSSFTVAVSKVGLEDTLVAEDFAEFPFIISGITYNNPRDVANCIHESFVNTICQRYVAGSYRKLVEDYTASSAKGVTVFDRHYKTLSEFCEPLNLHVSKVKKYAKANNLSLGEAAEQVARESRIVIFNTAFRTQQSISIRLDITIPMRRYRNSSASIEQRVLNCLDPMNYRSQPITYAGIHYNDLQQLCIQNAIPYLDVLLTIHNTGCTIPDAVDKVLSGYVETSWVYNEEVYKSIPSMLSLVGPEETKVIKYLSEHYCTIRHAIDVLMLNKSK